MIRAGRVVGLVILGVVASGVVVAGALAYATIAVVALTPAAWQVHPECARYAARVCDDCRPHLGYVHPRPGGVR